MAKAMDPILPILSLLGYWAIILGSFGGPGLDMILSTAGILVGPLVNPGSPSRRYRRLCVYAGSHGVKKGYRY